MIPKLSSIKERTLDPLIPIIEKKDECGVFQKQIKNLIFLKSKRLKKLYLAGNLQF